MIVCTVQCTTLHAYHGSGESCPLLIALAEGGGGVPGVERAFAELTREVVLLGGLAILALGETDTFLFLLRLFPGGRGPGAYFSERI